MNATLRPDLLRLLRAEHWNIKNAARRLGLSRQGLYNRMEKLNIKREISVDHRRIGALGGHQKARNSELKRTA